MPQQNQDDAITTAAPGANTPTNSAEPLAGLTPASVVTFESEITSRIQTMLAGIAAPATHKLSIKSVPISEILDALSQRGVLTTDARHTLEASVLVAPTAYLPPLYEAYDLLVRETERLNVIQDLSARLAPFAITIPQEVLALAVQSDSRRNTEFFTATLQLFKDLELLEPKKRIPDLARRVIGIGLHGDSVAEEMKPVATLLGEHNYGPADPTVSPATILIQAHTRGWITQEGLEAYSQALLTRGSIAWSALGILKDIQDELSRRETTLEDLRQRAATVNLSLPEELVSALDDISISSFKFKTLANHLLHGIKAIEALATPRITRWITSEELLEIKQLEQAARLVRAQEICEQVSHLEASDGSVVAFARSRVEILKLVHAQDGPPHMLGMSQPAYNSAAVRNQGSTMLSAWNGLYHQFKLIRPMLAGPLTPQAREQVLGLLETMTAFRSKISNTVREVQSNLHRDWDEYQSYCRGTGLL
jgi:hypothetical protein